MSGFPSHWWASIMAAGAPLFPYVGVALLISAGLGLILLLGYLGYRLLKRLPPISRYMAWRAGLMVQKAGRRRGATPTARLRVAAADGGDDVEGANGLMSWKGLRGWFRASGRHAGPVFVVIGAAGSGKSAVSSAGGVASRAEPRVSVKGEALALWWNVNGARALEVPPASWADGLQASFAELLAMLRRARPERPLDGIVLTVHADDLSSGDAMKEKRFDLLADAVNQLGMASGHEIPLDVVVCGGETLTGWARFVAVAHGRPELGELHWLNPDARTRPNVEAALTGWGRRAREAALAILATSPPDGEFGERNTALKFPAQLEALAARLAPRLERISARARGRENTPIPRSVLVAGAAASSDALSERPPFLALLGDAPGGLPFRVESMCRPTARFVARRRRRMLVAAGGLVASLMTLMFWMPGSLDDARMDIASLRGILEDHRTEIVQARQRAEEGAVGPRPGAARLLTAIADASDASPTVLLAPSSWFDDVRSRTLALLGATLRANQVHPRLSGLVGEFSSPEFSTPAPSNGGGISADRVEDLPAYAELRDWLGRIDRREQAIRAAERIPDGLSYQQLTQFLGDESSLAALARPRRSEKVPREVLDQIDMSRIGETEGLRRDAARGLNVRWERVLSQGLDDHPVVRLSDEVASLMDRLSRQQGFSARDAKELADALRRLVREAEQPSARRMLGKPAETVAFFGEPMARLAGSSAISSEDAAAASLALTQRREALRRHLLGLDLHGGVDRMFIAHASDGSIVLSPEAKRFAAAYASLMAQAFMRAGRGLDARASAAAPPMSPIAWNVSQLGAAREIAASIRDYAATGVQMFDPTLRPGLLRLAQNQARIAIEETFWQSARTAAQDTASDIDPVAALRPRISDLVATSKLYLQVAAPSEFVGLPLGSTREALVTELMTTLSKMDALLKSDDPYAPLIADVHRWMEGPALRPLSGAMRGEPRERLALARDYVRVQYVAQVAPMLAVLMELSPEAGRGATVQSWRSMVEALDGFEKGAAGNRVSELEQYVLNLSKWAGPDECSRFMADRQPLTWRSDYFSSRVTALDEVLSSDCARRGVVAHARAYEAFATWFNAEVAGHRPFGDAAALPAMTRRGFSTVMARYAEMRGKIPKASADWPSAVTSFLERMDGLAARFGNASIPRSEGDKSEAVPDQVVRARLVLRGEKADAVLADQIIDANLQVGTRNHGLRNTKDPFEWRFGEALELRLRWAAQSPYMPVAPADDALYTVHDRTATFRLAGDWAFFDLLKKFTARGDGYDEAVLRFPVQVVGPEGRRVAEFHAVFQSLGDRMPLGMDIPERAPLLAVRVQLTEGRSP